MTQPGQTPDKSESKSSKPVASDSSEPPVGDSGAPDPSTEPAVANSAADISSTAGQKTKWFNLRGQIPRWASVLFGVSSLAIVFFTWWYVTHGEINEDRIASSTKIPSPHEVYKRLPDLWDWEYKEEHLLYNTLTTLKRVGFGFLLATTIGVPLGILAGCFRPVESFLFPLIIFGRNIPIAALTMLTFMLFGIGEFQKVMFIFIACFAFIVADSTQSTKDVAQRYVDTAYTLGASRWQVIRKVLVPLALPSICNSLRLLFGLAFGYIMLAELVKFGDEVGGLGNLLNVARRRGINEYVYIIILLIPFLAFTIDYCMYLLQCLVFPYRYGNENANNLVLRGLRAIRGVFWKSAAVTPVVATASATGVSGLPGSRSSPPSNDASTTSGGTTP
jgi:ABC-type nitrate/sulfonate/bicarbonate transport system permease component